jgi:hypothetical protein
MQHSETDDSTVGKPTAFDTIVLGGLAVGLLDFLDASIFFPQYFGITVQRVWQGVAAGVLGRDAAVAGGWNTAVLGMILHFVVAFCIATVYFFLARNISFLVRHPIVSGLVYGVVANYVMQFVVIPLSAIGWRSTPFDLGTTLNSLIGHALLVGLPLGLIGAWSAKRNRIR